jgi:hypothetical protein
MSIDIRIGPADEVDLPPGDPDRHRRAADRRLCAAAYVDADFRRSLLDKVYNDRVRRVAPSHGFDIVLVLRHAWRAWWLEAGQNLVVLGILVVGAIRYLQGTVIAFIGLLIWCVLREMSRVFPDYADYYKSGPWTDIRRAQARLKVLRRLLYTLCGALFLVMYWSYSMTGRAGSTGEPLLARVGLMRAAAVLAYLAGAVALASVMRFIWLRHLRFEDIPVGEARGRRMRVIDSQQSHPFTVHSGKSPFIGSGVRLQGWSFAQRLVRKDAIGDGSGGEFDDPPFTAEGIIDELKKMIYGLRDDQNQETRLPGLTVTDHVFVEGTHADPFREALLASSDSAEVERAIIFAIKNPSDVARHYLACRVVSWGGEVVTSVFVHVSLQGRTLYLEFSTCALLPTRPEYRLVDEFGGTGIAATVKDIARNLIDLPRVLAGGRRVIGVPLQACSLLRPTKDQAARKNLRTDIGSEISIRESVAVESDRSYFQNQDVLQHSKIIERRLFAAVGDYLENLNVDTSEFWQRATAILNNGVINTGPGTVNIAGSAIGAQASVKNEAAPNQGSQPTATEGQS